MFHGFLGAHNFDLNCILHKSPFPQCHDSSFHLSTWFLSCKGLPSNAQLCTMDQALVLPHCWFRMQTTAISNSLWKTKNVTTYLQTNCFQSLLLNTFPWWKTSWGQGKIKWGKKALVENNCATPTGLTLGSSVSLQRLNLNLNTIQIVAQSPHPVHINFHTVWL